MLVLEAGFPACGATGAGMGHLVVMDDSPAQLALASRGVALWREQAPLLPARAELDWCGTLWLATNDDELAALARRRDVYVRAGLAAELLDAHDLARAEPMLRSGLAGALHVPGDGVMYQPVATRALLDVARSHGAVVRSDSRVSQVTEGSVRAGDETIEASAIVVAAGASSPRLLPELPIVPRRGHLVITERAPGLCRHQLVESGYLASAHDASGPSVAFNVQPRATGQVLVGSSREWAGWDASVNRLLVREMLARASAFLPALSNVDVARIWTGFRPATPDGLPLIGAWPGVAGVWVAAGHEGLGITMALSTGELLADLIAGRETSVDAGAYDPARKFAGGAAGVFTADVNASPASASSSASATSPASARSSASASSPASASASASASTSSSSSRPHA